MARTHARLDAPHLRRLGMRRLVGLSLAGGEAGAVTGAAAAASGKEGQDDSERDRDRERVSGVERPPARVYCASASASASPRLASELTGLGGVCLQHPHRRRHTRLPEIVRLRQPRSDRTHIGHEDVRRRQWQSMALRRRRNVG